MSTVKCVDNADYKFSLVVGREYRVISDKKAEARGRVRVVDDSGESYLFPAGMFVVVDAQLTPAHQKKSMDA